MFKIRYLSYKICIPSKILNISEFVMTDCQNYKGLQTSKNSNRLILLTVRKTTLSDNLDRKIMSTDVLKIISIYSYKK